jgi:hypothetical protein
MVKDTPVSELDEPLGTLYSLLREDHKEVNVFLRVGGISALRKYPENTHSHFFLRKIYFPRLKIENKDFENFCICLYNKRRSIADL